MRTAATHSTAAVAETETVVIVESGTNRKQFVVVKRAEGSECPKRTAY